MIDFTNCPRVPGRAYNGANGKKIAVLYHVGHRRVGKSFVMKDFVVRLASVATGI